MHQEDEQKPKTREAYPMQTKDPAFPVAEERLRRFQILAELNTQFGTDFDEDVVGFILAIEERLFNSQELSERLRGKNPNDALPIFGQAVTVMVQSVFEERSTFYTQLIENKNLSTHLARKMLKRFQLLNKEQRKSGGNDV